MAACNDTGTKSAYSDFGDAVWCCFPSNHGEPSLTTGIWTTDRNAVEGYNPGDPSLGDQEGNYTNSFGGTSSASPGVAGVAALVLARNRSSVGTTSRRSSGSHATESTKLGVSMTRTATAPSMALAA